jgi:hypothetical protein
LTDPVGRIRDKFEPSPPAVSPLRGAAIGAAGAVGFALGFYLGLYLTLATVDLSGPLGITPALVTIGLGTTLAILFALFAAPAVPGVNRGVLWGGLLIGAVAITAFLLFDLDPIYAIVVGLAESLAVGIGGRLGSHR